MVSEGFSALSKRLAIMTRFGLNYGSLAAKMACARFDQGRDTARI